MNAQDFEVCMFFAGCIGFAAGVGVVLMLIYLVWEYFKEGSYERVTRLDRRPKA